MSRSGRARVPSLTTSGSPAFRDYQHGLFDLLARPSDMRVHRGLQMTVPEPSGPPILGPPIRREDRHRDL